MMKKNLLKITGIFLVFLVVYLLEVNSAYADTYSCKNLKDTQEGTTHGSTSRFTGELCTTPGQYNGIKTCIGTTGYRYFVSYCTKVGEIYCEERYPEQGPNAPAACNKPDTVQSDISKVFGQIVPPVAIQNFGSGSAGISKFLSNFVVLIYTAAAIVLIFMLLWGAFDWMVSGGDKEALAKARNKILNAFIGILLFAIAFAVLQVLGQFTGFKFFTSPK